MATGEEERRRLWSERGWSPARATVLWAEEPLRCPTGDALPVSVVLGPEQLCTLQVRELPAPAAWAAPPPASAVGEWDGPVLAVRGLRPPSTPGGAAVLDWAPSGWLRATHARRRSPGPRAGRLPPLGGPGRIDDLGVIVLAVDPDGRVLVARRARALRWRGGGWTATASGAVDPVLDRGPQRVGLEVGLRAGARELAEEAALLSHSLRSLRPLGLVREWRRGGKPELVLRAEIGRVPGFCLQPSDEVSALRAIPDAELRADPRLGGRADLPLRVALALHWTHPQVPVRAAVPPLTGADQRSRLRAPGSRCR
ncbi:MAG: hypothetical protein RL071_3345 [Pseudomonadota bacterium]